MNEIYFAYVYRDGLHNGKQVLNSPKEVWNLCIRNNEVTVTDVMDFTIVQRKNGRFTFPPEWVTTEARLIADGRELAIP